MRTLWLSTMMLLALPLWAVEQKATALYYRMSEPGVDPYLSRILVTADYLRIDEGNSDDNYILFDRRSRTVYSVVHGDRTILDIPARPVDKQAVMKLDIRSLELHDQKMPSIEGQKPSHRELRINNVLCYSVIAVDKVLSNIVQVMRDYRTVMAGEHAKNIENTPLELRDSCFLALHIHSPVWLLESGLPIQEWEPTGRSASLLNYTNEESFDDTLFTLPNGYRHYQTQSLLPNHIN